MSPRGHSVRFTEGGLDFFGGRNDQNSRPFARSADARPAAAGAGPVRGSGAPILIQASKSATTASGSFPLGGIWRSSSR